MSEALDLTRQPPDRLKVMLSRAARLGDRLAQSGPAEQRRFVLEMVDRIDVQSDRLRITLLARPLRAHLGHGTDQGQESGDRVIPLDIPVRFRRRGVETKLVMTGEASPTSNPDPRLIAAVAQGHRWFAQIRDSDAPSVRELSERLGVNQGDVSRILPGHQPIELTARRLKRICDLPVSWAEQRRLLGFA